MYNFLNYDIDKLITFLIERMLQMPKTKKTKKNDMMMTKAEMKKHMAKKGKKC